MLALLFINKDFDICLRLIEHEKGIVDSFGGSIKFKDNDGEIHDIPFLGLKSNDYKVFDIEGKKQKEFRKIIEKEGVLSGIATQGGGLFEPNVTHYKFKFYLNGLEKAMRFLQPSKSGFDEQNNEFESDDEEFDSDTESESVNEKDIQFSTPESESVGEALESRKEANNTADEHIHDFCDKFPVFEGGDILAWVSNHKRINNGRAKVSFVVEKDGSTSNIKVLTGHGISGVPEEAIRLVKMMKWRPGIKDDKPVRSQYNLTINFDN